MPRSKRDKKVSLTKTKKKGLENKKQLVTEIQNCLEKYKYLFVISVQNMRNTKMREIRQQWVHSRFFFGKNKVMALALGKTKDTEYQTNLHQVSDKLQGQTGLLFTDKSEDDVIRWFDDYVVDDFARSGNKATHTINLEAGPIPSFSHSLEPQLRQLGLPTSLEKGIITLLKPFTVCKIGDVLNPEQARILKLFDHKMAKFKIKIDALWIKKTKTFKTFDNKNSKSSSKKSSKTAKVINICGSDLAPKETAEVDMESDGDDDNMAEDGDDVGGGGGDNDVGDGGKDVEKVDDCVDKDRDDGVQKVGDGNDNREKK